MTAEPLKCGAESRERIVPFLCEPVTCGLAVGQRILADTAVMLATGSYVVVAVERTAASRWLCSDLGLTHAEASFLGFASSYERHLRETADELGLALHAPNWALAAIVEAEQQLAGAIACVANGARRAFDRAFEARAVRPDTRRIERLAEKLRRLVHGIEIEPSVEIVGASNHRWHVDARIRRDGRQLLLELVTPHPNSVAATVTKFHDIARLPDAPGRIAVVPNREAMGTLLGVLSQAASVVEETAPDTAWRRALAA